MVNSVPPTVESDASLITREVSPGFAIGRETTSAAVRIGGARWRRRWSSILSLGVLNIDDVLCCDLAVGILIAAKR
jgi:hypothetical protein